MAKEAIISTPRLNSYGTRVLTEGIDTEQYKKNPVLLFMHRRGSVKDMPIGRIENLRVEGDTLYGTPVFDNDLDEDAPLPEHPTPLLADEARLAMEANRFIVRVPAEIYDTRLEEVKAIVEQFRVLTKQPKYTSISN